MLEENYSVLKNHLVFFLNNNSFVAESQELKDKTYNIVSFLCYANVTYYLNDTKQWHMKIGGKQ